MPFNSVGAILLGLSALALCACGETGNAAPLIVTGTVDGAPVEEHTDRPILAAVLRSGIDGQIGLDDLDDVLALVSVDKKTLRFEFDLTDSGLQPGDEIVLAAFVDVDAEGQFPNPNPGDYIGFYMDEENFATAYRLHPGRNNAIRISINRLLRPHTARVSGVVKTDLTGDLLIAAYAGEIDTLDFTDFDPNKMIGYARLFKGAHRVAYTLRILPYPQDVVTDRVYMAVFLDEAGTGILQPGNLIGFHTDGTGMMPELLYIDPDRDCDLTSVDIDLLFPDADGNRNLALRIPEPSGDTIVLSGVFETPSAFNREEGAVFLMVADSDHPPGLPGTPLSSIAYFARMPVDQTRFSLDLTKTGLALGDEVMVLALWDRDFQAGFPRSTAGDQVGLLQNKTQMRTAVQLSRGLDYSDTSGGWTFAINKVIYDHRAAIDFLFSSADDLDLEPQPGDAVIAVAVTRQGLDLSTRTIDMDYVVGMTRVTVGMDGPPYTLKILPAIYQEIDVSEHPFGISDLYLFAILDANENGAPDIGEALGFSGSRIPLTRIYLPRTFDVVDGMNVLSYPVVFTGDTY